MIYLDPVTKQRVTYQPYCGDLQYAVKNGSAVSTQVIPKIGLSAADQMNLGRSNALQGTIPGLMGQKEYNIGITGENKQTTTRHKIFRRVEV